MLVGREHECAQLEALIDQVRGSTSKAKVIKGKVIVIKGEAGIGKSSLLEHAVCHADGLLVLRAQGIESEQNLPYGGLAELLSPILGSLNALPGPQRAALAGALAIGPAAPADRFAVCAATLHLLGAVAAERPVLAVVDDVHWLDAASAQAVEFAAHRLGKEALGFLLAVRDGATSVFDPARLDSLPVSGLDRSAAAELLRATGRPIAPEVAKQLADGMGGNPLALLELAATLTEAELSGLASLPEPLPVAAVLQRVLAHRLEPIPPAARWLLLLAAADAAADLPTLQRASGLPSVDITDVSVAEEAGVVRISAGRVEFTHPLLRSVVYHSAKPAQRRAAHRALAEGIELGGDPMRTAWHQAAATAGPDESVAQSLDLAANAARARNAFIAASRAHQRAAELTPHQDRQVSRWMAAGQAAYLGGDVASASGLLSRAAELATDPCVRADAQVMRAHATLWATPAPGHYHQLVAEADTVLPFDHRRAATLLALAAGLCIMTGQFSLALQTATRATSLSRGAGGIPHLLSTTMLANANILTGHRAAGRLLIADILAHPDIASPDPIMQLLRMLCGQALIWCEEHKPAGELLRSSVASLRTLGRVADLPYGLAIMSDLRFRTGEWGQAYAYAAEAVELGTDFATENDLCYTLVCAARIEAALGTASACHAHIDQALSVAKAAGVAPTITGYAAAALGLLDLGTGNYQLAVRELTRAASIFSQHAVGDPCVIQWRPDFIEGLVRIGRPTAAREQLAVLDSEAAATGSQWAKATAARCRGLLPDTPQRAITQLEEAVTIAETSANAFEQARAHMCLGDALSRARHPSQARREFERAHLAFELLGAQPWAQRAAKELRATAPHRKPIHARLTPQEMRVALQVADGLSNQEVATRLFLSHKTVEVHLSHIYEKLGVHSRTGMAKLISSGAVEELPPPVAPGRDLPGHARAHNWLISAPLKADPNTTCYANIRSAFLLNDREMYR